MRLKVERGADVRSWAEVSTVDQPLPEYVVAAKQERDTRRDLGGSAGGSVRSCPPAQQEGSMGLASEGQQASPDRTQLPAGSR